MHRQRTLFALLGMIALLFSGFKPQANQPVQDWRTRVDPWVLTSAAQGDTEFLVFLSEQADLSNAASLPTKAEKGAYVYQQLTAEAERTQGPVLRELAAAGVPYQPYWVANMIWVRGGMDLVSSLASRPDVAHIYANPSVKFEEPSQAAGDGRTPGTPDTVEWNISQVHAPQVWSAGYTGQGAVIGGQDTGYQWNHPALVNHYRGNSGIIVNHNYNWHDAIHSGGGSCGFNSPVPCDDYGHGTHTMGTMVGDDGGTNQTGMAPGARWIGCRNMNVGVGTPATYSECYQWFIAPTDLNNLNPRPDLGPDVINNSWGCPPSEGCTDPNVLLTVVNNVRAAGILTAHSAGNSGGTPPPNGPCSTINEPAAIYENSFTVGATDNSDTIAGFSSRGPVSIDGSNRLKPNVSAPGVNVRSSVPGGTYSSLSGTSMAAPHVAGLVALLISARPSLAGQVEEIETLIERSALPRTTSQNCGTVPGTSIPNNTYGWGRIDALAAYQAQHRLEVGKSAPPAVAPGSLLTYTLSITDTHPSLSVSNLIVEDELPANTTFVSAMPPASLIGSLVHWTFPSLPANSHQVMQLVVRVDSSATGNISNGQYSAAGDYVFPASGPAILTPVVPYSLQLVKTAPTTIGSYHAFTYTLSVTNPHTTALQHNLTLTDTLPAGVQFVSASPPFTLNGNTVGWQLPGLAAGALQAFQISVRAPVTATGQIINNNYAVRSDEVPLGVTGPPVTTTILNTGVALSPAYSAQVLPGTVITLTHTITNTGLSSATFDLEVSSNPDWTNSITLDPLSLDPGQAAQVEIPVNIPPTASGGTTGIVTLTAQKEGEPAVQDNVTDTIFILYGSYLPFIASP